MIEVVEIWSGNLSANKVTISDEFHKALGIFFSLSEPSNIGYDIGLAVITKIPIDNNIAEKEILLNTPLSREVSTFEVIPLPSQIYESSLSSYVAMNSSRKFDNVKLFAIIGNATKENIKDELDKISLVQSFQVIGDTAIIANQLAQNTALALLAGSLIPITLGTSSAALPPLASGSSGLLAPILIP